MTRTFLLLAAGLLLAVSLSGQTATGEINGTILDPTGAAVADAAVRLINQGTRIESHAISNSSGYFVFLNVQPGNYILAVTKDGFRKTQTPPFEVTVNQTISRSLDLALGSTSEVVEVTGAAPITQAASSELGTVIERKEVEDLPLNGRNFTQLLSLTPGATPVNTAQGGGVSFSDAGPSGIPNSSITKPSMHGQQNRSLLYFQDGILNTDLRGPIYGTLPIIDVLQEFKIQSHNDKAEFGGVTGGIVNVISKSGGNSFHGSAYEFVRNDAFDARNGFVDTGAPAPFRQNEFGATIGGPIKRNRTFFFAGWEAWRYSKPTQGLSLIPTAAELDGDLSQSASKNQIYNPYSTKSNGKGGFQRDPFVCNAAGAPLPADSQGLQVVTGGTPCNKLPASLISPGVQGFLKAYLAAPNFTASAGQNYVENRPQIDNANSWQAKVDHRFSDNDNIFFRFSQILDEHVDRVDGTNESKPSNYHGNNWGGGWTHLLGPNMFLDVRAGMLQKPYVFNQAKSSAGIDQMKKLGFNNIDTFEGMVVTLASPWFGNDIGNRGNSIRRNPDWSASANLSWVHGRHNFKFGYQYIYVARDQINTFQTFGFSGGITNNPQSTGATGLALASALLGFPSSSSGELPGGGEVHFRLSQWAVFAQDEWRLSPKLTVNLGVRWDVITQPQMLNDRLSNALDLFHQTWLIGAVSIPNCPTPPTNPCIPNANGLAGVDHGANIKLVGRRNFMPPPVYDNVGPRAGFAWQVLPNTVVRAGYGLYFDGLPARSQYAQNDIEAAQWPWVRAFSGNPNNVVGSALVPLVNAAGNLAAPVPASPWTSTQSTFFDDPKNKDAWSQQWNLEIQRQLNSRSMISLAYVGSKNGRVPYTGNANAASAPSPAGTPLAQVDALKAIPWMNPNIHYTQPIGYGTYNSLQARFQRRLSKGLLTLIAFTWSKALDNSSGYFGVENGAGQGGSAVSNYFDLHSNYSVSGYDIPHFISWYTVYELPFGRGKRWLNSGPLSWIAGNWQFNYIFQARSGQPVNLNVGGDPANISGSQGSVTGYSRPNLIADPFVAGPVGANPDPLCQKTLSQGGRAADVVYGVASYFNPCAFGIPANGTFGNLGRNVLRTAHVVNLDTSLFKNFKFNEQYSLQMRFEAFNLFNIQNYGVPNVTTIGNTGAGRISSIVGNPRQLQIGARIVF